ncbi:hypothetical protein [Glaesserella parasuis]|nr:hypothetical protein [Glaesserella parasuis]MDG6480840.1 hypothetical protein [Glaesserella parasuis]
MQNTLSWLNNYRSLQIEPYALFDLGVQKNSSDNAHSQRAFGYGAGLQLAKTTWKSDIQWVKGKMQREKTQMWEKEQRRQINRSGGRGKRCFSSSWQCKCSGESDR